ncbi:LysR family transcriptional regulator [Endozoicomonas sp. SM1973]|uniref:LysR family transcriptional regulator n=1 Tax=Spartinivicinus marinus TaxID=2994442 RepID=A0A853I025_9GAMM|nr:LysR family transcriptional regulator [Spartinivicinus marinus]MCX4026871.1 LysR family transcriptional regulator [Spartinivicinus marinus]NYZ66783.1 LysR family transcriptional regulator [Spartinivicinus marinus]
MALSARHVEIFIAIMRAGSLTEAARQLHISQPAVTKSLQHAEQRLGYPLFQRLGGRLQPTPEAKALFKAAQDVEHSLQRLNQLGLRMAALEHGMLEIMAPPALAQELLPIQISQFQQNYPQLQIQLNVQQNADIANHIAQGEAELGIVHFPTDAPELAMESLGNSSIVALIRQEHPLASSDVLTRDQLINAPVIWCSGNTWWAQLMARELPGLKREKCQNQVNYFAVACRMATQGLGIALVDRYSIPYLLPSDCKVLPVVPEIHVSLGIIYRRYQALSQPAKLFIKALRKTMFSD